MRSDTPDIIHQNIRLLENMVIDPLQNIKGRCASLTKDDAVRVVDVAVSVWTCFDKLATDLELTRGNVDIHYFGQDQNLSELVPPRPAQMCYRRPAFANGDAQFMRISTQDFILFIPAIVPPPFISFGRTCAHSIRSDHLIRPTKGELRRLAAVGSAAGAHPTTPSNTSSRGSGLAHD
jgi:hypothetical protein